MHPRLAKGKAAAIVVALVFLGVSLSGCFYLVLGAAAAAGGYAISSDTIQGETEKDFQEVWDSSVEIASIMGMVSSKSPELGKISATIDGAKVNIQVLQLTTSTTRLKVKARKGLFPNISTAQNIFVKIMNRVNG
ncbi:MAG TPA: DUF3568 family protein [Candidatus Omnitrophota bacterium]|nr:DUF3568 family protein [Candidatus Omnitrophota bacterium]HPD84407.1 DUF3568 family protein [Candidatus Omnitrophota bacterium]HRZ03265.1 DUF3568 family protein [Candidatus Omnitrophota bacterium]